LRKLSGSARVRRARLRQRPPRAGQRNLKRFDIAGFETLDDSPLGVVLARLRRVPGSDWRAVHDSYAEFEAEKAHDD
jgi:hypothetical protein